MPRTIPGALATAFGSSPRKGAECLILEAKDGARAGFTTWSGPIAVDLGLGAGEDDCLPGINLSTVILATGLDAGSFEADGPARGDFSGAKIRGGKWRGARAWLVRVSPGVEGFTPIMAGTVGEGRVEGRRFTLEIRNAADAFNQSWGRVLSPWCSATFGDFATGCPVARTPIACTVTAVTDDFRFTVDLGGVHPDAYFNLGAAAFLTGDLAGTAEVPVAGYVGASGAVELFEPLVAVPEVGDTLNLYRGCSKLLRSENAALPTCVSYGAAADFQGFPEVPSSRFYHKVSAPGAAYA